MLFSHTQRSTEDWVRLDKRHVWHPFTQMQAWCAEGHDPLVLTDGEGPYLFDSRGRRYFDGNSSIWTNIHGHKHPAIHAAIREQLEHVAHVSFLGTTNAPAIELAVRLSGLFPDGSLPKVFFSDNGSTAIEVALKMAVQYFQLTGESTRCRFAAFENAYHGDTAGAASVGGIAAFHGRFSGLHFPVDRVGSLDDLVRMERPEELAAVVIEPLIQGAAGMRLWPAGMLRALRDWCDRYGVLLILDEVMTGFGRTGAMFACQKEDVVPDFLALAKGLTGGYLPLAATLTTDRVFDAFLGTAEEQKTLYYGHSYAGNAVGCAAAIASLMVFEEEQTLVHLQPKIRFLSDQLELLKGHPHVIDVRQCGFIAGIEIARNPQAGERYPWTELRGARVCMEARKHGLLTRPVLDTLTLMPPLCATEDQIAEAVRSLRLGINAVCGG